MTRMEKYMKTELRKPFTHGFVLTEQELRRIYDTMVQQMKSIRKEDFSSFFELRYKNGVRAEKASLEEIISDNNIGIWEIQELKMTLFKKSSAQETRIEIELRVPPAPPSKEATTRPYSIQYYIVGDKRDWVYLTSSQLDDRIAKIKQLPIFDYGILAIVIGGFTLLISLVSFRPPPAIPLGYKIAGILVSILLIIGGFAGIYGFRRYNFCWGDSIKNFNNRRAIARMVLNVVIIGLALSVIGSVIGSLLFAK